MNKNLPLIITGICALIVGFGGGYFLRNYKTAKLRNNFTGMRPQNGQFQGLVQGQGNRPIEGEVLDVDGDGITVKLKDGSSKIIIFSNKTTISKSIESKREDLVKGNKVIVIGMQNSDGSLTANSVTLNN
jgi:hypothetical protein